MKRRGSSGMREFNAPALRRIRRERGLGIEDLAVLAGVSPESVRRAESGRSRPSGRTVVALAKALGRPVGDLVASTESRSLTVVRQLAGLTQGELAARLGVTVQSVSRVERGVSGVRDAPRWAHAYGLTLAGWMAAWHHGRDQRRSLIRS